ncbi:lysoplasmalogenase TMEM86A-like [Rhynchophorus ferrugineus]|uniref:lysoplasmalogenase TMEM86A-like n=1 Tax=Rhynchophorus ferrugineus TaxID=354439 RepID=UPI003FCEAF39
MVRFDDVAVHLLPFFVSVSIYFGISPSNDQPLLSSLLLKCSPIVCLMYFVETVGFKHGFFYPRKILAGLVMGCIGDAVILWQDLFAPAMLTFGVGHFIYSLAFGFLPLNLGLGSFIYSVAVLQMLYLLPSLPAVYIIPMSLYGILICTCVWRAAVRLNVNPTVIRLITFIGTVLFVISDFTIAVDKFMFPLPYAQILIMSTYYLAQLAIALSVTEPTY